MSTPDATATASPSDTIEERLAKVERWIEESAEAVRWARDSRAALITGLAD